jgi:hypothetical protein
MQKDTILKGIGQVILMITLNKYLQTVDAVAVASPSLARPILAQNSQNHDNNITLRLDEKVWRYIELV